MSTELEASAADIKKKQGELSKSYINLTENIASLKQADQLFQHPETASTETLLSVFSYYNVASQLMKAQTPLVNKIMDLQATQAAEANPKLMKSISQLSQNDKKTVTRWGFDHFSGTNDVDELLGSKDTVVVLTVASKAELDTALTYVKGDVADLPDYVYLPAYKDAKGKQVAEQAVSVAEYLKSQLQQSSQKPEEKSNGRN